MQEYIELIKKIRFENHLTQEQLAKKIGVTKGYISLVEAGRSKLSPRVYEKITELYPTIQKNSSDLVVVKFYVDVIGSCGNGAFEQSQEYTLVQLPKFIVRNYNPNHEYAIITAKGNSMSHTIEDGDQLLVEILPEQNPIIDNDIYVFCYEDVIYIKRLIKNIDQIIVKSDNNEIPTRYIDKDNINNLHIIGKIKALVRNYLNISEIR